MSRIGRTLFLVAFVAVVGGAAWVQFTGQRTQADDASSMTSSAAAVFDTAVRMENAARDYTVARDAAALDSYDAGRARLASVIQRPDAELDDATLHVQLAVELARRRHVACATVDQDVAAATAGDTSAGDATRAAAAASSSRTSASRTTRCSGHSTDTLATSATTPGSVACSSSSAVACCSRR